MVPASPSPTQPTPLIGLNLAALGHESDPATFAPIRPSALSPSLVATGQDESPMPSGSQLSPSGTPSGSPAPTRKREGRPSCVATRKPKKARASQAPLVPVEPVLGFLQIPLPHHEIIHRTGTVGDPHIFRLLTGVTDGTDERFPELGVPNQNNDALYHATPLQINSWLLKVGNAVAAVQQWPGAGTDQYMLEAFPERYHLLDNISQTTTRSDLYLYGSSTAKKKFRTANEFCPHLVWLLRNGPPAQDPDACQCKNCTGAKYQRDVNLQVGIPQSTGLYLGRKERSNPLKPNQQLKKPFKGERHSPPPTYLGSYTNKLRDDDLNHKAAPYRQSEMVWARLSQPLVHSTKGPDGEITHWPGLVVSREVRVSSKMVGALSAAGEPPKFETSQRWVYNIQLLALDEVVVVEEYDLLPWLGLSPTTPSPADLKLAQASSLVYDGKTILTPTLDHFQGDSRLALPAFALAIHSAAHIVLKYAPTDPYKPENGHIISQPNLELSLADTENLEQQRQAIHFQSVWWGAEQIHSEELVRVVVRPLQIDQETTLPLSSDIDGRGFLFKLSAIFRPAAVYGKDPEIKVAGSLVELVKVGDSDGPSNAEEEVDDSAAASLPKPPSGYKFRQVTRKDSEVHIDLEYIAGRYYSLSDEMDSDPIRVQAALQSFLEAKNAADADEAAGAAVNFALTDDQIALVLAGVLPGWHKCTHASTWAADRLSMVTKAENTSNEEMKRWFEALGNNE